MPDQQENRVRQKAVAGRDANTAGRDQFIINVGAASAGEPTVPGLLPRDVPGFTGRDDELARLTTLAGAGRVVVTVISGTAGVGKTALAVHAAHRLLPEFPEGQLYADLRGYTEGQSPAESSEVLNVFLRRLGVSAEDMPAGVEERSGMLRSLLASRRVLMLLDNAASEAQVRPLLPGGGRSLVLVTSRSVLPGLEADERISLDVLPQEDAAALLANVIGGDRAAVDPEAVLRVQGLCGRLPLALRIAGQILTAHPAWPVAKLAGMLADERDRLGRLAAGDLRVRTAFGVSYRQLAEGDARTFRLLGLHPGPDFDVQAAAALAGTGTEPEEAERALHRLVEACLITEDASGRFGMHDLLRLFARDTCYETDSLADQDASEKRLVNYYVDIATLTWTFLDPRLRRKAEETAAQTGRSLPSMRQALAVFEEERPSLLAAVGLAARRGWDELVGRLSQGMNQALIVLHHVDDLRTISQVALVVARSSGDLATEGLAQANLGYAYQLGTQFDAAIACYQQALTIFQETDDRRGEGQALLNLATVYGQLARFGEAVECFRQDIGISRETGDRHVEGSALANLGRVYQELRQFEDAVRCYQQALTIFRETADHRRAGQAQTNLGNLNVILQRFDEAISCYQQAAANLHEAGDFRGVGQALTGLGTVSAHLRQFEDAGACYQQALSIFEEIGDHSEAGHILAALGNVNVILQRFDEAISCYQQAAANLHEAGDFRGVGRALTVLGTVSAHLRQLDLAATYWQDAAQVMRHSGDLKEAARLEQLAADARSHRRRWRRN